ncbi:hypothetical protein [Rufibacter immobilis]|uniref:hypothetical protein n=1 Tax=Rufibacter immobilis TaxID=1348778 RepID=UPI0035E6537F
MTTLNKIRFNLIMFKRRLMAVCALLNKDQFLLLTYRVDSQGKALPHKYVQVMPTETIISATGLLHQHTKAQADIENQVQAALAKPGNTKGNYPKGPGRKR